MVQKKYLAFYSAKSPGKPGPKEPDQKLVRLVLDTKHRNPRMDYDHIAMQVLQTYGVEVNKHVIQLILARLREKDQTSPYPATTDTSDQRTTWHIASFCCEGFQLNSIQSAGAPLKNSLV